MAYCGPRGIPYTTFLGWDPLSQDAAIAWAIRENDACGGCGLHRSELLDADGVELRHQPYEAVALYCPGCAAREKMDKSLGDERRPGVHVAFIPASRPDAPIGSTVGA